MTEDELKAIVTHEFEDDNLAFVRDIFVFVCFTALSFIDVKELTTESIVGHLPTKCVLDYILLPHHIAAFPASRDFTISNVCSPAW